MPEPKQARSRETQGRIVAAALELVVERGREGPSVPEIAERAGVSIGAFYGRFPTKEALFDHVDRQLFEESARCWVAFLAPENWRGRHAAEIVRRSCAAGSTRREPSSTQPSADGALALDAALARSSSGCDGPLRSDLRRARHAARGAPGEVGHPTRASARRC